MVKKFMYAALGLALAVSLCGCALLLAGAAGGAGTAFWLSGKLSDEVGGSYDQTIAATKKGLTDLDMIVAKETKTDEVAQIRSKYIDDSEVWIDIRPLSEKSTKVEIRVGVTGDKTASTKILESIKNNL